MRKSAAEITPRNMGPLTVSNRLKTATRVAFFALATLLVAVPARATPPPLSETESVIRSNETTVEFELEACSRAATARRRFGVAEVAVDYRRGGRPVARLERGHYLGPGARCVDRALRAARLDPLPKKLVLSTHHDYEIGEVVRPFLPPGFLAAWQAAVADPRSGRARLAALLPPTLRPAGPHCLRFAGPDLLWVAMEEWLGHDSEVPVQGLFDYYARPGDWWISHRTLSNEGDFVREREREEICLDHVDPVVSDLRRAAGDLWQTVGAHVKIYFAAWDVFDAVWIIDPAGHVVGEVEVKLVVGPGRQDYARQALPLAVDPLKAAIAKVRFRPQRGFRQVNMHYADGAVRAAVRPTTPLLFRN